MTNKEAPRDNDNRPAVGGPVQRQVRPSAWQWLHSGVLRKNLPATAEAGAWGPLYDRATIDNEYRSGFIDGQIQMRGEFADLLMAVESIIDAGHMNTEDLARLRAAWEMA